MGLRKALRGAGRKSEHTLALVGKRCFWELTPLQKVSLFKSTESRMQKSGHKTECRKLNDSGVGVEYESQVRVSRAEVSW